MASGESIWKVLVFVVIVTYVCYITEISNFYPDWNFATNLRPSFIDKIASVVRAEDSREEIEMTAASGELSKSEEEEELEVNIVDEKKERKEEERSAEKEEEEKEEDEKEEKEKEEKEKEEEEEEEKEEEEKKEGDKEGDDEELEVNIVDEKKEGKEDERSAEKEEEEKKEKEKKEEEEKNGKDKKEKEEEEADDDDNENDEEEETTTKPPPKELLSSKERLELIYKELPEGREKSKRYFSLPLTTTWSGGGVGNQLFEVFALLGLSNSSHRTPLVFQKNGSVLGKMLARIRLHFPALIEQITLVSNPAILENTTDVALHRKGCCRYWPIDELLEKNTSAVVSGRGIYFQSHLYWIHIRPSLLKWMTPSEFAANETKYAFRERDLVEGQVLCVHARRGNFLHTRQAASEANFTQSATKYIIKKYLKKKPGPITVLLFSNDLSWMRETYSEIYRNKNDNESFVQVGNVLYILVDNLSAFNTLIVAKDYCDNFLITAAASTYAYMMSFLAKNGRAKVFYAEHFATPYNTLPRHFNPKEFHLPHWIPLRLLDNLDITQISRDEIQPWATTSRPTTKKANG